MRCMFSCILLVLIAIDRFVDMSLKPFNSEISNFEYNQLNIITIKEIPSNGKRANNDSLAYS